MPQGFPKAKAGKSQLVVILGDCASCSAKSLDLTKLKVDSRFSVILVHRGGIFPSSDLARERGWADFEDVDAKLETQLNVTFVPRAYIFDDHGLLTWNQPAMGEWPAGVKYAG